MASIDSEPKPGTAFKKVMEEQAILDEFMTMVKKKLEIDKRHLDDLIELKKTWNPKWSDTGVSKLISPILTYITEEIAHLITAEDNILARFSAVPEQTILQEHPPSEVYDLKRDYGKCEYSRRWAADEDSWYEIANAKNDMERLGKGEDFDRPFSRLLPRSDRNYRVAVHIQRQRVSPVVEWYDSKLEGIVELHQQRAEDIKAFFIGLCDGQGKLVADLSASCSAALHSTRAFAPTRFIAPRREEVVQERSHLLLRKFEYHNFFDGRIVRPLFGVSQMQTLMLANLILDTIERPVYLATRRYSEGKMDRVFDLEESALTNPDLEAVLRQYPPSHLRLLLKVVLWSEGPLFFDHRFFSQFTNGVPRKKLHQAVQSIDPGVQERNINLLSRLWPIFASTSPDTPERTVTQLLCGHWNVETRAPIIRDIWRKWDFDANRPLPDGVTREVVSPWALVRTKTGAPYIAKGSIGGSK